MVISHLPQINFGTYQLAGQQCYDAVRAAIDAGYQGIDTASIYRNEQLVGQAIRDSGKQVFLTTKLNPTEMGFDSALLAFENCLQRLGMNRVDLVLIHWPGKAKLQPDSSEHRKVRIDTWRALEKLKQDGKARYIGVSNFTIRHIQQLMEDGANDTPYVNQVEVHVHLQQRELKAFCSQRGILLQAYSPLGSGGAPVLRSLAKKPDPVKYALHAALSLSDSIVIKSADPRRISENLKILQGSSDTLDDLSCFEEGKHYCWNPDVIA